MNYNYVNGEFRPDIGVGDPRTLSEWAVYIAAAFPDINSDVSVTVHGRKLKKTYLSGLDALLEQANKKDGKWYLFREVGLDGDEWLFYKGKLTCREPDLVIRSLYNLEFI